MPPGLKIISPPKSHVPFSKSKNNGKSHHWNGLLIVWFQSLTRINLLRPAGLLSLWLITLLFQHWGSWEDKKGRGEGEGDIQGRRLALWETPTTQMTKPRARRIPTGFSPGAQTSSPGEPWCQAKVYTVPRRQWEAFESHSVALSYYSNSWHSIYHYLLFIHSLLHLFISLL